MESKDKKPTPLKCPWCGEKMPELILRLGNDEKVCLSCGYSWTV